MTLQRWQEKINKVTFAFQPIIDLRAKRIYGFEALLRNYQEAGFNHIFDVFDLAFQNQVLYSLDLLLREKLIFLFTQIPEYHKRRVLYNLDNRILEMPNFESGNTVKILQKYQLPNSCLIFEISERLPFQSYSSLSRIITNYRNQGFRIAIDDFGVGYSSLQLIYSIEPDILKLDRFFISNIHKDLRKRLFVEQIVKITHLIGGIVIAEGVESYEELLSCIDIGIDLAQGFYISEPFFLEEYESKIEKTQKILNDLDLHLYPAFISKKEISIKQFNIDPIPPITIQMKFEEILEHFKNYPDYHVFPVVNEFYEPLGILREKDFKRYYLLQYTRELLKYKNLTDFLRMHIRKNFILESNTDLQNFFDLLSQKENVNENSISEVIVTEKGKYKGIIFPESILKYIFQQKLIFAKEVNPLTNLPGNQSIQRYIRKNEKFVGTFAIVYLDINYFKPFNDVYGFEKGDKLILFLGNFLRKYHLEETHYFVGHIGGDDFILFVKNKKLYHIIKLVLELEKEFKKYIKHILPEEDKEKNYIIAKNRFGIEQKFELPSISAGILFFTRGEIPMNRLSYYMAHVKNQSKNHQKRNIYYKIL